MNKSLHAALLKIYTSGGDSLSHICDVGVFVRKMLQAQKTPNPDYTVGD
jgi:hypothetical protein